MQTALIVFGVCSASLAGGAFGYWGILNHEQQKISRSFRLQAGADGLGPATTTLLTRGIHQRTIIFAIDASSATQTERRPLAKIWFFQSDDLKRLFTKAGLAGRIDLKGCAQTRRKLSLRCALAGFVIGLLLSEMLALLLCAAGFIVGYRLLQSSLKDEVELRASSVEQELSQLIEVLVLGLRSGLSFDRSLSFYCHYFKGGLSQMCQRLKTQWDHGLITREEGLRALAESYDSPLLERVMESIIRSLRFGTSMAETLSNAGTEIRATRKAKLEERVAKAPVKMLIPIGTLILPAMLILILGPIILELIEGF